MVSSKLPCPLFILEKSGIAGKQQKIRQIAALNYQLRSFQCVDIGNWVKKDRNYINPLGLNRQDYYNPSDLDMGPPNLD